MTNRAVCSFFAWLEQHGIGGLVDIEPFHVACKCDRTFQKQAPWGGPGEANNRKSARPPSDADEVIE